MRDKRLPARLKSMQKNEQAHQNKLAKRSWQLLLPKSDYVGDYAHPTLGTVKIEYQEEELIMSHGNLSAVATPYPLDNAIRVEMIPGSGRVAVFELEENKAATLQFYGEVFTRAAK